MKNPQEIIKKLINLGFKQCQISKHTQVPEAAISRILRGKQNPRWQTVEALQSFLDTVDKFDDESI